MVTHRPTFALRTSLAAVAALVVSVVPSALPASAAGGPTLVESFTIAPDGYPRVGKALTGTVGTWTGSGTISYELRWDLCMQDGTKCVSRDSLTTTDPTDTLTLTPTASDNVTERILYYSVTATDSAGQTRHQRFVGRAFPDRRWYSPTLVHRGDEEPDTGFRASHGAIDSEGVATVAGIEWGASGYGIYAKRIAIGDTAKSSALLYKSDQPENDPTRELAVEVDEQGRVHVVFIDDGRNLMVTERDPSSGTWSSPTQLASAGTFHDNTFREADGDSLLVAGGNGRAAVAWVSGADADDPAEMNIATRGASGWGTANVHRVDQPKEISCGTDFSPVTIGAPTDAELGIDPDGDVTVIWTRSEQTCPGDPYQGYNRLEAAYRRNGSWGSVAQLNRMPGFYGNYVPVGMDVSGAGAAVALTRSWFEGDSSNGRENLLLLTAAVGSTFGTINPETNSPATVLRRWADGGEVADDGHLDLSEGLDVALSDAGGLHVGWSASGTGVPSTLEVASGTLGGVDPAVTVAAWPGDVGRASRPTFTQDETGNAALVFRSTSTWSAGSDFALYDPADGWSAPQTIDTTDIGNPRWSSGSHPVIRFDDKGRLNLLRNGAYGSPIRAAVTRLAAGSAPPEVDVPDGRTVKLGSQVTITPLTAEDPDGGALSFAWDLDGDGEHDDGTTREVTRTYGSPGRYDIGLRVTAPDGDFAVSTGQLTVVANSAPTVYGLDPEGQPTAGQSMKYIAYAGDDFDEGADLRYAWRFDNVLDPTQTGDTATHTFGGGSHNVSITVTDTDGLSTSYERSVSVQGEAAPDPVLTVTKTGTGSGTVTGDGIDCGNDCSEDYLAGTSVILSAAPAAGSTFAGWTGCTSVSAGKCTVTLGDDVTVTAQFQKTPTVQHTLTVKRTGTGSGRVDGGGISCGAVCSKQINEGTEVTLVADPAADAVLTDWHGCTEEVNGNCVVAMDDDVAVTAQFDVATSGQRTLTVTRAGAGSGAVTGNGIDCGTDCTALVAQGAQVQLTAAPGASSRLKGWSGCDSTTNGGNVCVVTLSDDTTVGATFVPRFGTVETTISSTKVNARQRKATIAFTGSSPAGVDRYECKLDTGAWVTCTSAAVLTRLSRGSHTFLVRVVDGDGITDKTPAEVTFTIRRR